MFFNKEKNDEPRTEEFSGVVRLAKDISFYDENGENVYESIAGNEVYIKKVLNYVGKKLTEATISVSTGVDGTASEEKRTISDEVYTLGATNDKDFYFVELGLNYADVIVNISKTPTGELASILIRATGDLDDGITMLEED